MTRPNAVIALAAAAMAFVAPAMADGSYRDRVYADSFGNLVIHSTSGYKRILVGKGYAAESYNLTGSYYEPEVVYAEEKQSERHVRRCSRPPHRWQGRSYMYGLPDHVVPQAPIVCE